MKSERTYKKNEVDFSSWSKTWETLIDEEIIESDNELDEMENKDSEKFKKFIDSKILLACELCNPKELIKWQSRRRLYDIEEINRVANEDAKSDREHELREEEAICKLAEKDPKRYKEKIDEIVKSAEYYGDFKTLERFRPYFEENRGYWIYDLEQIL